MNANTDEGEDEVLVVSSDDEDVADQKEEATDNKFMGIDESKIIISKLLQDYDDLDADENIIMALRTCLRLLEEESRRNNGWLKAFRRGQ